MKEVRWFLFAVALMIGVLFATVGAMITYHRLANAITAVK